MAQPLDDTMGIQYEPPPIDQCQALANELHAANACTMLQPTTLEYKYTIAYSHKSRHPLRFIPEGFNIIIQSFRDMLAPLSADNDEHLIFEPEIIGHPSMDAFIEWDAGRTDYYDQHALVKQWKRFLQRQRKAKEPWELIARDSEQLFSNVPPKPNPPKVSIKRIKTCF